MSQDLKLQIMLKAVDKVTRPLRGVVQTAEKLRHQMAQTHTELKNARAQQTAIDHYRKLNKTLSQTARNIEQAKSKAKALKQAIQGNAEATKQQKAAFNKASQAVNKLVNQHRQQKQALQQCSAALKSQGIDTRNLNGAQKQLASNIATVNQRLGSQAKQLDSIRKKANAAAKAKDQYDKSLKRKANLSIAGAAGYATGTKVLRGVGHLLKVGIGFEKQMSSVAALAGVDKQSEAFAQLQAQARKLGAATSFTASEVAQGMQKLAMAGFDVSQIRAAMPGMLNLAKAGNNDLEATADIASNILSGFRLEAAQMNRVSDVLAAAFTSKNVNLQMLGETLKYAAPIAQEFGSSLEEASALAGMLGNVGIQGSMAGTAMRTMYNNIAAHTPAIKALKALGIATRDANGNMRAMPNILAEVANKTEAMGAGDRLTVFKAIAGKQAGAAFAALVGDAGAGAVTQFIRVLDNARGTAQQIADDMVDNVAGDLKELESAWESFKITLFTTNSKPLRELIQHITAITRKLNDWIKEHPKLAGQLLKIIVVGGALMKIFGGIALSMAGVLGPLVMLRYALNLLGITAMISRLFGGFVWVLSKLAVVTKLVAAMQWRLNIAMLANPIFLVIAAVAGLIGIGVLLYKKWDAIMSWFGEKFDWLKSKLGWIGKAGEAFKKGWNGIMSWINKKTDKAVGGIKKLWDHLTGKDDKLEKTVKVTEQVASSKPMLDTAKKVVPAAVLGLGLSGAAFAGEPQIPIHPPIQAKPAMVQHVTHQSTPNITIQATPGMDEIALAKAVARELENQQRQQAARQNSQLYDGIH